MPRHVKPSVPSAPPALADDVSGVCGAPDGDDAPKDGEAFDGTPDDHRLCDEHDVDDVPSDGEKPVAKHDRKRKATKANSDREKKKRTPNAFMLYSKEQRSNFDTKTTKVTEIARAIGAKWRELGEEEKTRYRSMAEELKAAVA